MNGNIETSVKYITMVEEDSKIDEPFLRIWQFSEFNEFSKDLESIPYITLDTTSVEYLAAS